MTATQRPERLQPLDIFAGTLAMFPEASFDFSHVAAILGRVSPSIRSSLGAFSRSSLWGSCFSPASDAPDGAHRARDPWPMPPPLVPAPRVLRSGRARERERVRRSALQLVQQAVDRKFKMETDDLRKEETQFMVAGCQLEREK